jgi:hypothetical protein
MKKFLCITAATLALVAHAHALDYRPNYQPEGWSHPGYPDEGEPVPTDAKPLGDIVFRDPFRACWAPKDCEVFPGYETWIIWKFKSERPGSTYGKVCITSQFITQTPSECAWVTKNIIFQPHTYRR